MQRLDSGFPIDAELHRWGVTIAEFRAKSMPGSTPDPDHAAVVACTNALGFGTICAELSAPRSDRPVLEVKYELAPVDGVPLPDPAHFVGHLTERFGAPGESSQYEIPADGDPSGSVRFYANWNGGDVSVGLSLYGSLRQTPFGPAPGCLWLSWSPVKAAQPYAAEWRARTNELAAREPARIAGFLFGAAQMPVFGPGGAKADSARREAHYALYHPELLATPPSIAALTGDHGAAFWRFGNANWCASTAWDTLVLDMGAAIDVSWNDIAPAKGGGFSEIAIGRWAVRDWHGSRAVRDALAHLQKTAGVHVKHLTGFDC